MKQKVTVDRRVIVELTLLINKSVAAKTWQFGVPDATRQVELLRSEDYCQST